jgi:hypothetical protein
MDDRNYYRRLSDRELIELAKHVNTSELSVVLAERLKQAKTKLEEIRDEEDEDDEDDD